MTMWKEKRILKTPVFMRKDNGRLQKAVQRMIFGDNGE